MGRVSYRKSAPDDRSKPVDAFAALLLALWAQLQQGKLTPAAYLREVGAAFDAAVASAPPAADAKLAQLRATALERAEAFRERVSLPDGAEDAPSEAQRANWANMVAGALWAAHLVTGAYREQAKLPPAKPGEPEKLIIATWVLDGETSHPGEEDDSTCDDCPDLDGQEWPLDAVPQWPGDGGTQCSGNCRCAITVEARTKAAAVAVLKVARCGACHRKLGEQVNADARLFCPRCRETVGLIGA